MNGWLGLLVGALALLWAGPAAACPAFIPQPAGIAPPPFVPGSNCDTTCHKPPDDTSPSFKPRNAFGTAWASQCLTGCDGLGHCGGCTAQYWGVGGCVVAGDADNDAFSNDEELTFVPPTNPSLAGDVNECAHNADCVAGATCSDPLPGRNDFVCTCPAGLAGDGRVSGTGCDNIDECDEGIDGCSGGSDCQDTDDGYICVCPGVGTVLPGQDCPDTDLCDPNPCSPLSTCLFAGGEALCRVCPAGYADDPSLCPTCPAGYTGTGVGGDGCLNIDECAVNDPCYSGVTCSDTEGAFRCGACPAGFIGDGIGPAGCVRDVCSDCSRFASCVPGAQQPCQCNPGFRAPANAPNDGRECVDTDECAGGLLVCPLGTTCVNLEGSFLCACQPGFKIAEGICQPATCETWGEDCGPGGSCDDSSGTPACVCTAIVVPPGSGNPREPGGPGGSAPAPVSRASSPRSNGLAAALLLAVTALGWFVARGPSRRRLGARQRPMLVPSRQRYVGSASVLLVLALSASQFSCGDDDSSPAAAAGGAGGAANGGSGGAGPVGNGGAAGTSDTSQGGSGGTTPVGAGGTTTCTPLANGGSAGTATVSGCTDTRDCEKESWCNPAVHECQPRQTNEVLSFREIATMLRGYTCTNCHLPGGPGAVATDAAGEALILDDQENFYVSYASLVGASVTCAAGTVPQRICVDEPASSRIITKVFDTGNGDVSIESIAFTSWSDEGLQKILRWIARGAPREATCGNYVTDPGEQCDSGPSPSPTCAYALDPSPCQVCTKQCTLFTPPEGAHYCGDGQVDAPYETCDDGNRVVETVPRTGAPVCGRSCTFEAGIPAP